MKFVVWPDTFVHSRVIKAGLPATGLWMRAGCWLAKYPAQGELVPSCALRILGAAGTREADQLVRCGLWRRVKGGYLMLRYVSHVDGLPVSEVPLWSAVRDDYRRRIPQDTRDRVMERDERRCTECGATDDLTLDHIYPWSLHGPDDEENLRVLCRSCNSSKGARV